MVYILEKIYHTHLKTWNPKSAGWQKMVKIMLYS